MLQEGHLASLSCNACISLMDLTTHGDFGEIFPSKLLAGLGFSSFYPVLTFDRWVVGCGYLFYFQNVIV